MMQLDSEPTASKATRRRGMRWRIKLSLRVFLVFTGIAAVVLSTLVKQTRQQYHACRLMGGISYTQNDPPVWIRFLPESWLNAYGGHWCRSIDCVEVSVGSALSAAHFKRADQPLTFVAQLPYLREIKLSNLPFSNDPSALVGLLKPLAKMRGLEAVQISVAGGGYQMILSAMPDIPALKKIVLVSDGPNLDASLHGIQKYKELESITLQGAAIDSDGFRELAILHRLKSIEIPDSLVTQTDLEYFRSHPTLERLVCNQTMADEMLQILASCPNMRMIDAANAYITDATLVQLTKLRHLETLVLSYSSIGDEDFSHLANCKSLKNITCTGCKITDGIGLTLAKMPQLESIELAQTLASGRLLPYLHKHRRLSKLRLNTAQADLKTLEEFDNLHPGLLASNMVLYDEHNGFNPLRSQAHLFAHSQGANLDHVLSMSGMVGLKGRMHDFKKLPLLHIVELAGTDIDDSDLRILAASGSLHAVDIEKAAITTAGLSALKNQNLLESLSVGPFENADQAMQVVAMLSSLKVLGFRGSERLSESGVALLRSMNLHIIQFPDRQFDGALAKTLCQIPGLHYLIWSDRTCDPQEIMNMRLQVSRETLGIPNGLQAWLIANRSAEQVTIVDEREWPLLMNQNFRSVYAKGARITGDAIDALASNLKLTYLDASGTGITNGKLRELERRSQLKTLILNDNPISDEHIGTLRMFWQVKTLGLSNTNITDEGLSKIFNTFDLDALSIAGTSTTGRPWHDLGGNSGAVRSSIDISDVAEIADVLKNGFATTLPGYIQTHRDGSGISDRSLMVLRKRLPTTAMTKLDITPALMQAWSIDEMLGQKTELSSLGLHDTRNAAEVLNVASRECLNLRDITIANEPLYTDTWKLPPRIQSIHFKDCTLTNSILDALTNCIRLRSITFEGCDLNDCQLEKLANLLKLAELKIKGSPLSQGQVRFLKELESSLVSSSGW